MARKSNAKAKEKKQKIIAAVGGVLLLALLAYQVPKVLNHGRRGAAPAATTTTATTTTPGATTTPPAATGTSSFAASTEKLASFTLFSSKDPFVPRVSDKVAASSTSTSTPPAATPPPATSSPASGSGPLFGTVDGPATSTPSPKGGGGTTTAPASNLPGATLKLNGKTIRVQLGQAFPVTKPMFRLAGIKSGSVRIALVKGGLADGTTAITVQKHHPLTLVNTVDNKRWTIVLLSASRGT